MSIKIDYEAYHKSISEELQSTKDRVRNLIGKKHWLSDGKHKEAVLKKVLHSFIPESKVLCTGFAFNKDELSREIDILICDKNKPTLFKEGDLRIVTSDTVEAIVSVKTAQTPSGLKKTLADLIENAKIARIPNNHSCWAGLFVYEKRTLTNEKIMEALGEATQKHGRMVINCIATGTDYFVKYWDVAPPLQGYNGNQVWRAYKLPALAQAYFISNLVEHLAYIHPQQQFAWFPILDGKEKKCECHMALADGILHPV